MSSDQQKASGNKPCFFRFEESYRGTVQNALPFAMNSEFSDVLKETMVSHIQGQDM